MEQLTETSRFTGIIELGWSSGAADHTERYFSDRFNMWRDLFPLDLHNKLLGKSVGERVQVTIAKESFVEPWREQLIVPVHESKVNTEISGNQLVLNPGRFYPQHILKGVAGVFETTVKPCRFMGREGDKLLFDLNHPLAKYDLNFSITIQDIEGTSKERGGRCEDWLEIITSGGPGMQARNGSLRTEFFVADGMLRADEEDDSLFYQSPRLVHHLDKQARAVVADYYGRNITPGSAVLDLMASWESHLPEDLPLDSLALLGLNEEEMQRNKQVDSYILHDLNARPHLPFASGSFDNVICTASVEYLIDPEPVFSEIARVLKPLGEVMIVFSNRFFPTKAISLWSDLHEFERMGFVLEVMLSAGCFERAETFSVRGYPRPADDKYNDLQYADPLYCISARRPAG